MKTDNLIIKGILRQQSWERAKGELRAMLVSPFFSERAQFEKLTKAIDDFVKEVENNGLQE